MEFHHLSSSCQVYKVHWNHEAKLSWAVRNESSSFVSEIIRISTLFLTIRNNASNLFRIEFIFKWPIINLSGLLDFISWSPTLASVKLILFEQTDLDLDTLLLKTDERDSLLLSKTISLSKTKTIWRFGCFVEKKIN